MKSKNSKLKFNSHAIVELNDAKLNDVKGGTTLSAIVESYIRLTGYGTWLDHGPV